ncbi:MAG: zinc-dependent metalloprotease [Actinomycetota bacterium]
MSQRAWRPETLIDLDVAARFAARFASAGPLDGSYLLDEASRDLVRVVREADALVLEETGFEVNTPATCRVMNRREWAEANITGMAELMSPLLAKVEDRVAGGAVGSIVRAGYRPLLGLQLGTVLGIISHRVIGQYDSVRGITDEVWFVGPNVVLIEKRLGFVPKDFRLWVALHELTHRAQFRGNPWMRNHFLSRVEELITSIEIDPRSLLERLARAFREGDGAGPLAVLDPAQRERFETLQAFMSVLEGHANFVMDRLAAGRIPTHPRMKRTLQARTALAGPVARILQRLIGLDLKRLQYQEGQKFFEAVHARGGDPAVRACFEPHSLPTLAEVRDPEIWMARVGV